MNGGALNSFVSVIAGTDTAEIPIQQESYTDRDAKTSTEDTDKFPVNVCLESTGGQEPNTDHDQGIFLYFLI